MAGRKELAARRGPELETNPPAPRQPGPPTQWPPGPSRHRTPRVGAACVAANLRNEAEDGVTARSRLFRKEDPLEPRRGLC